MTPDQIASRLAEIREYLAQLEGDRVQATTYQTHLNNLLAAYDALVHERDELRRLLDDTAKADELVQERDAAKARCDALAEAVLAFHDASRTALMPRDPYNRMLTLARAGRP